MGSECYRIWRAVVKEKGRFWVQSEGVDKLCSSHINFEMAGP